jgi:hypothetical protein
MHRPRAGLQRRVVGWPCMQIDLEAELDLLQINWVTKWLEI